MIEWKKVPLPEYYTPPLDTVYIIPCDKGIEIFYNGEQCVVENIGVQEFVEALKTFENPPSFKTDFKSEVERAANHPFLPQKHATT